MNWLVPETLHFYIPEIQDKDINSWIHIITLFFKQIDPIFLL